MEKNIGEIVREFKDNLNIEINSNNIDVIASGMTSSLLFRVNNKYLYKIFPNDYLYKRAKLFFETYKDSKYSQHILFSNDESRMLCLDYAIGDLLYNNYTDGSFIIDSIYDMVSNYKEYNGNDVNFINWDCNTLEDYIEKIVKWNLIDGFNLDIFYDNLSIVKKYNYPKYVLHGDMGSHNIVVNNKDIKLIDPDTRIGDKLFDFYCCILSDPKIFKNMKLDDILKYFDEYDIEYKKSMFNLCYILRMNIALKYNYYDDSNIYKEWLDNNNLKLTIE